MGRSVILAGRAWNGKILPVEDQFRLIRMRIGRFELAKLFLGFCIAYFDLLEIIPYRHIFFFLEEKHSAFT